MLLWRELFLKCAVPSVKNLLECSRIFTLNFLYEPCLYCRLCVRDPHKLFQRLDEQGQEYVLEVKKYLLHQLASGNPVSALLAKQFLATLLDEYDNLCSTADTLALILAELVSSTYLLTETIQRLTNEC